MPKDMKMNIRTKIAIGYILVICCLSVSIVIVTDRISALQNEVESITSGDIEIHNLIASIRSTTLSMETGQRGYLLTGNETYLEPYYSAKAQWEAQYNSLYEYLSSNVGKKSELEEIKLTIVTWINSVAEPTIRLKKNGQEQGIAELYADELGSQNIDDLRSKFDSLHAQEIQSTKAYVSALENRNQLLTIGIYIMLFIVTVIAFLIVTYVSNSIVNTIKEVTSTIKGIASVGGDLTTRIKVNTKDEIRELGDATNELLTSLEMKSWIQMKVAEVATMSQGINDLATLGKAFLSKVAPMIHASYGVFYIRTGSGNNGKLVNIASYAGGGARQYFLMGEGLIGQCAVERRIFLLNGPQDHSAAITTAMGQIQPQSILIVPIEYEDRVEAVVEFASLESFSSQHLKLLEEIEVDFGIAVNNVAGRMEVDRLLRESQVLTENLQAHTEELQAQSEELQMQQDEMRLTTEHLEKQNIFAELKTKELEKAKQELENYSEKLKQSSQYKTNFLANMSHELRTPLNSILILSQMLSDNENRSLTDEEQGYAQVIHSSGKDLLKLIDDILDLSKVEAGKIIITIDEINVSEIPEILRHQFEPIGNRKNIDFVIHVDEQVPYTWHTDGQRLQQILKNLLSNAFKFSKEGSVTLQIKVANRAQVEELLPMNRNEQVLAISVCDTGIGIPLDKQQLIFEAFQQVDGDTNRQYGGTGLGLSICNEFTRLLGGKIILDSKPGVGSTFTLLLPNLTPTKVEKIAHANEEIAVTTDSQVVIISPKDTNNEISAEIDPACKEKEQGDDILCNKRVLIVEDDARNVYALVKTLEKKGVECIVAGDGNRCLEILKKDQKIDLILMDIMMPNMDGYETMQIIRQDDTLKDKPIIALTSKAMNNDRERCLEAGASDYISKPINMEQLFSLMSVWLSK